jgi:hypothetical protein
VTVFRGLDWFQTTERQGVVRVIPDWSAAYQQFGRPHRRSADTFAPQVEHSRPMGIG